LVLSCTSQYLYNYFYIIHTATNIFIYPVGKIGGLGPRWLWSLRTRMSLAMMTWWPVHSCLTAAYDDGLFAPNSNQDEIKVKW